MSSTPVWRNTQESSFDGEVWEYREEAPDYQVSNFGRVRIMINRLNRNGKHFWKGKIITQNYSSKDKMYLRANLRVEGSQFCALVHRLVAKAFVVGYSEDRNQVNHKDGVKTNNNVSNLEWVTEQENKDHAIETGLQWYLRGEERPEAKLTEQEVLDILEMYYMQFLTQKEISSKIGMCKEYISLITRGKRWRVVFEHFVADNKEHYDNVSGLLKNRNGRTSTKLTEKLNSMEESFA